VLGVHDGIKTQWRKEGARVCGATWQTLFERTGLSPSHIWRDSVAEAARTIWTAGHCPGRSVSTSLIEPSAMLNASSALCVCGVAELFPVLPTPEADPSRVTPSMSVAACAVARRIHA
jgi:hypothetical protein